MHECPNCRGEIRIAELPRPGLTENFRVCPHCRKKFTVDSLTKRRQLVALPVAVVSLVFTFLLYYRGTEWLVPAVISYVALAGWIYWGNKNVRFVPFEQPGDEEGDG